MNLWLDTEAYSECDLRTHGTYRYATDKTTELIVVQWAVENEMPSVCDLTANRFPTELVKILMDDRFTVTAHNSWFDRLMLEHVERIKVPIPRWRDTMVKALAHGLPGGLDKIGAALGIPADQTKDKRGDELIKLFCKPRPKGHKLRRATRHTHPGEWQEFLEYSFQDIIAMREIDSRLPTWNYRDDELALWHLDQLINTRGFAVDTVLAQAAITAVDKEQARIKAAVVEATDGIVSSPSKRDTLLAYILAEHGVDLPDMAADTLRRRAEDPELPEAVRYLIGLRLEAAKSSTSKYKALLKTVGDDGRMRGTLQFCGASRTGRWAGRMIQPQNFPRPDMEAWEIETGIEALKAGCAELVTPEVMRLTANAIRGCIVAPQGRKLVVADLSNIEGRGLAFLAGEQWKLDAFREFDAGKGEDLYKLAYARSFNCDPKTVTKSQRQIGKVEELGLGYEGGVGAFLTFAAVYNMDLDAMADAVWAAASAEAIERAEGFLAWTKKKRRSTFGLEDRVFMACEIIKSGWRDAHSATKALWGSAADAVRCAINKPGESFAAGEHLVMRVDGSWLRIRLPSGRYLCYLHPRLAEDGTISYSGINQYTRQWGRIKTYGGKIVENATQGLARDVMAANMPAIEAAGYEIVLSIHDELPTETPDSPEYSADGLCSLMTIQPHWAKGLPLAAAGFEAYRYKKD